MSLFNSLLKEKTNPADTQNMNVSSSPRYRSAPVVVFFLFCLPFFPPQAAEFRFSVPADESKWSAQGDRLQCRLVQTIPGFGEAGFLARAGGDFSLYYMLKREPAKKRRSALLRAVPPPWKHQRPPRKIAEVLLRTGKRFVTFERDVSLRTLYELEKGMIPELSFRDWADATDQMRIALSPVNLRGALKRFQACVGALHPDGYEMLRKSSIHFPRDSHQLTPKAREQLRRIAAYQQIDSTVTHIVLTGYADGGDDHLYNQELAQLRVDAVKDYLITKGVPEKHLIQFPSGAAKKGRQPKSRRVEILLEKD